jgi:hypothetical protein
LISRFLSWNIVQQQFPLSIGGDLRRAHLSEPH